MPNIFPISIRRPADQFPKVAKAIFVASAIVFLAAGCAPVSQNSSKYQNQPAEKTSLGKVEQMVVGTDLIEPSVEIKSGWTALDLLKSSHRVETKTFSGVGEYVVSIDGIKETTGKNFWALYVNGKQSQVGASDYTPKDKDKIEWKLEELKN
jgi:hypothetical protein